TAGGCLIAGCVTSTQTAAPGTCGGVVTETWTFIDPCGRGSITKVRTITVSPAPIASFTNPPQNVTVSCGGIPAVSCLAYSNAGAGGCLIAGCVTSTQTTAPGLCGGVVTETWTFTDACQRTIFYSRAITVNPAAPAACTSTPSNVTVNCGQIPAPTCLAYSNGGSGAC